MAHRFCSGVVNYSQVKERFAGLMLDGQPAQPLKVLMVSRLRLLHLACALVEMAQVAKGASHPQMIFSSQRLTESFLRFEDQRLGFGVIPRQTQSFTQIEEHPG
jgi:hypothetical protein